MGFDDPQPTLKPIIDPTFNHSITMGIDCNRKIEEAIASGYLAPVTNKNES